MLAAEDLVDLGEALRDAGFRVATQQHLAAQQLLLRLAAEGALPPTRLALGSYLGPILCTSALEQRRFEALYGEWLDARFPPPPPPPSPPPPPPPRKFPWKPALAAVLALVALVAAWPAWQHWRERVLTVRVVEDGQPVADAEVKLTPPGTSAISLGNGLYEVPFTAAGLPARIGAKHGDRVGSKPLAPELVDQRSKYYLGTPLSGRYGPDQLDLLKPATPAIEVVSEKSVAPSTPEGSRPQLLTRFDVRGMLPAPTVWDRIEWPNVWAAAFPLLLFFGWQAWRRTRRPALVRMASRTPPQLREVHLPGGVRAVLPGLPLRRLAQELRRRRTIESSELQTEPTIAATLRRGGIFTPVRGSRVEPDYFALVDRASVSDHQALLAGEIVAELARSDVLIERYDFDRDAALLRPRETHGHARLHPTPAPGRPAQPQAVELADLQTRCPDHRVLVFGDGTGCFDSYTGAPAPWLATLLEWPAPVLLTPLAPERWGRREWALQQLGVTVLPLSQQGLVVLMSLVGGAPAEPRAAGAAGAKSGSHERTPRRWLERDPPPPETAARLCDDLLADLGPRGFAWVAACAAYPEIHWGITLRLGPALVPDRGELERLLTHVARLVWFREAYMPDWLREALLERLAPEDEDRARETLRAMLAAVVDRRTDDIPLRIATGEPTAPLPWWRQVWDGLRQRSLHQRAQDMVKNAPADSPLRDYVFLEFLSGKSQRRIDLAAPGALLELLRAAPRAFPTKVAIGAFAWSAIVAWQLPPVHFGVAEITSGGVAFAESVATMSDQSALFDAGNRGAFVATSLLRPADPLEPSKTVAQALVPIRSSGTGWTSSPKLVDGDRLMVGPGGGRFVVARDGALWAGNVAEDGGLVLLQRSPGLDATRTKVAFSDDGSRFAMGADDGLASVWDARTGKLLARLGNSGQGHVTAVALNRDGTRLATGQSGAAKIWNVDSGAAVLDLPGESQFGAFDIAFSPDGSRVAAATGDDPPLLWDATTGRPLIPAGSRVSLGDSHVRFSANGRLLATWGVQGVNLWDTGTGQRLSRLGGDTNPFDAAFGPDGAQLATIDSLGAVRLWDIASGEIRGPALRAGPPGRAVSFSPDGRTLAASGGQFVSLWSIPAAGASAKAGRSFALVVGNDYAETRYALQTPVLDARNVAAVLRERFGFDVTLLENGDRNALIAAADRLAAGAQPDDRIVVFLAGIGAEEPRGRYAFMAAPRARGVLDPKADAVYGDEIARRLARSRAREILVLGDTSKVRLLAQERVSDAPALPGAARILIASYTTGDPMETRAGSPFALALVAALRQAGAGLTATTLLDQIASRMQASKDAGGQRPILERLTGAGDAGGTFTFPDPLPATAATAPPSPDALPALGAALGQTTVSGLSAGGFMAVQFHVAHSSVVRGAGVIAGGPYYCAQGSVETAYRNCMQPTASAPIPAIAELRSATDVLARSGRIDPTAGLKEARVWLFSGTRDEVVSPSVVEAARQYYAGYMPPSQIAFVRNVPAGNAMVTAGFGAACGTTGSPFIVNCDFDAAGALLAQLYGGLAAPKPEAEGVPVAFDQRPFAGGDVAANSLAERGYVYVPRACQGGGCRVHVVFHGCRQNYESVGDAFVRNAGYNRWADANRIIVLYPQAAARTGLRAIGAGPPAFNPNGCWDWWGYTGPDYHTKAGPQIRAVRAMLDRLAQRRADVAGQAPAPPQQLRVPQQQQNPQRQREPQQQQGPLVK